MANERGNVVSCLNNTLDHVSEGNLILSPNHNSAIETGVVRNYYMMITHEITAALEHLKKLRAAAEKAECKEVLAVLDEKIEY